jgi:sterol desaturase/sphingolipid hydroxylase (fatty acid hydroxylase superfamily)
MMLSSLPSPINVLLDPISLTILAAYAVLMVWEAIMPARELPVTKGWRFRTTISFAIFFFLSTYLPMIWDQYLAPYQLVNLSGLGIFGSAVVGLLVYELAVYIWHRGMHRSTLLWRSFHQMHHSADRLDTWGAFYFSPLDMIGWTALSSFTLVLIVGVPAEAATIILLATTFFAIFQHANIRTPQWLGYIIQRPEAHTVHHGLNHHADNYSDLPLFDILFGTFRNPRGFDRTTGFYPGASGRIIAMLLCKDIIEPTTAADKTSATNKITKTNIQAFEKGISYEQV